MDGMIPPPDGSAMEWSPDNPFGVITPYHLIVGGKWRLSAAIAGMFLCEYVTCPFCENQKGLTFRSDCTRLDEMADITCPEPCGRQFQIMEILGYDLQQRLAYLAGEETDAGWEAKVLAEDPGQPTGPLPPADEPDVPPASPEAVGTSAGTAEPRFPRMRAQRRKRRAENHDVTAGPAEKAQSPVRVTTGPASRQVPRTTAGSGRTGRITTVTVSGNNQQINVRTDSQGSRVTVDGKPVPNSGGPVPRKVAARAERAIRDAERLVRETGGRSSNTVQVHGRNNSVITNNTDGDQVHTVHTPQEEQP